MHSSLVYPASIGIGLKSRWNVETKCRFKDGRMTTTTSSPPRESLNSRINPCRPVLSCCHEQPITRSESIAQIGQTCLIHPCNVLLDLGVWADIDADSFDTCLIDHSMHYCGRGGNDNCHSALGRAIFCTNRPKMHHCSPDRSKLYSQASQDLSGDSAATALNAADLE